MKVARPESELMCRKSMILPSRLAEREDPLPNGILFASQKVTACDAN
jgi:hypothetical protein